MGLSKPEMTGMACLQRHLDEYDTHQQRQWVPPAKRKRKWFQRAKILDQAGEKDNMKSYT